MTYLGKLWRGEYALPVAFWKFYCGGQLACAVLYVFAFVAGRLLFHRTHIIDPSRIISIVCYVLLTIYVVVASVGVWRSADAYWKSTVGMRRFWAGAARVIVFVWIANVARGLIVGAVVLSMTGDSAP
jgi:hypothetical protein